MYDLTGLIGIKYNGNIYHYIKNLQGDIIGLLNVNNEQIVSYEYDSWGSLISIKDQDGNVITDENNIGIINPFRYREYYYDSETGMYYLNSRYYNPTWGRFINADGIIGANQDILGYNLYAYVSNNPINSFDVEGQWKLPNWAKVAIGVAFIAGLAVATALTVGATSVVLGAALTGAVYGGVTGGTEGAINGAVDGFLTGTLTGGLIGGAVSGIGIACGAVEVIGTARYGKNMLVEVVSKSQTAQQMNDKCLKMVKYNPKSNYSVVSWVANIGKVLKW